MHTLVHWVFDKSEIDVLLWSRESAIAASMDFVVATSLSPCRVSLSVANPPIPKPSRDRPPDPVLLEPDWACILALRLGCWEGFLSTIKAGQSKVSIKTSSRTHHGLNLLQSVQDLPVGCALELLAGEYVRIKIRTRSVGRTHSFRVFLNLSW